MEYSAQDLLTLKSNVVWANTLNADNQQKYENLRYKKIIIHSLSWS